MKNDAKLTCVLVGELSLLQACGEILTRRGHHIVAVASNDDDRIAWAESIGARAVPRSAKLEDELRDLSFDYLFSITNFQLLHEEVLALPAKAAINFHDGPLPEYAGLNVPAWALINGEREHGISWHEMTAEVDRGDVLAQERFAIDDDDTVFSVNAKCYEVGLDSFAALIGQLETGRLEKTPQTATVNYYGLRDRPAGQCVLDLCEPAESLHRLCRALDFGRYFNPLGVPKLWMGDAVFAVGEAQMTEESPAAEPATVLAVDEGIEIATGTSAIRFEALRRLDGTPVVAGELGVAPGERIVGLTAAEIEDAGARHRAVCVAEPRWIERLRDVEWVDFPYLETAADDGADAGAGVHTRTVAWADPANLGAHTAFAVVAAYLGRIGRRGRFHLPVGFAAEARPDRAAALFCEQPPLGLSIDQDAGLDELSKLATAALERHATHGTFARDLLLRSPEITADRAQYLGSEAPLGVWLSDSRSAAVSPVEAGLPLGPPLQIVIGNAAISLMGDARHIREETIDKMGAELEQLLSAAFGDPAASIGRHSLVTPDDRERFDRVNRTEAAHEPACIHTQIESRAAASPDAVALVYRDRELTYAELNERANRLAGLLIESDVHPGDLVGLLLERSPNMVIGLLAVLKAGAAYVPMDPTYPAERLQYMARDSGAKAIVADGTDHVPLDADDDVVILALDATDVDLARQSPDDPDVAVEPDALCYVIYTSGSTGKPKGVMLEHRSVSNFLIGMDERIGAENPGTWLAVTSISFDISVLELLWTLSRGFKVVLHREESDEAAAPRLATRFPDRHLDLGLFYWNIADEGDDHDPDRYRLLLEGAKFADEHGFSAVWTPERHFGSFGGLYPNPSVTGAAVAAITRNVAVRAGSCVVPLHHPIRVAEEWAVVDVISGGRVGLSMASGWMPNDFVIRPESFADPKGKLIEGIDVVRRLWRGETMTFDGPRGEVEVRTLPRPIQKELPTWVTAAGNPETFRQAAELGANVLTHLLGQTVEEVGEKIALYRETWRACGHAGEGTVTLMLHTFVGDDDDETKELVREPMKRYLKSALNLVKAAAWEFPTFKKMSEETNTSLDDYFADISEDDLDGLLDFAFERYYETSGLLGSKERCLETLDKVKAIGVDEIACLIDFGIDTEIALRHLADLDELRGYAQGSAELDPDDYGIPALIRRHQVTHFQCTPSMAGMLLWDPAAKPALAGLECMMVGGEAMPEAVAAQLREVLGGRLLNMYGPTETTIWSTTAEIAAAPAGAVPLGTPIANTQLFIVDERLQPVPVGVPGELVIGGQGVARGYLNQEELTGDRFVPMPDSLVGPEGGNGGRLYRTGDLVRYDADDTLHFLGRLDHQIKIRGFRIELGEIEAAIRDIDGVEQAVVSVQEDSSGEPILAAYYSLSSTANVIQTALRRALRERLPQFMVPQSLREVDAFPLTPNGKIDRLALRRLYELPAARDTEYEPPDTPIEQAVAGIWSTLLETDEIGRHDLFFDLGGHSLLAVRAASEIGDQLGVRVPPRLLLTVTLSQLAASCESLGASWEGSAVAAEAPERAPFARRVLGRLSRGAKTAD